jgi:hypothetical protein
MIGDEEAPSCADQTEERVRTLTVQTMLHNNEDEAG